MVRIYGMEWGKRFSDKPVWWHFLEASDPTSSFFMTHPWMGTLAPAPTVKPDLNFSFKTFRGCLYNKPHKLGKKTCNCSVWLSLPRRCSVSSLFHQRGATRALGPFGVLRRVRACQAGTRDRWADGSIGHKMPCNYGIFAFMHQDLFFWKMCHPDLNMNIADIIEQFILPSGYLTVCHGQSPCY